MGKPKPDASKALEGISMIASGNWDLAAQKGTGEEAGEVSPALSGPPFNANPHVLSPPEPGGKMVSSSKQLVGNLTLSGEQLHALFENSKDAILISDPLREGRIISVNSAACHILGWTEEELIGQPEKIIFDPGIPLEDLPNKGDFFNSERLVLSLRRKNGTTFLGEFYHVCSTDVFGEQKVITILRDVSEDKRAQEKIHLQNSLLEGINRILNEASTCDTEEELGIVCLKIAQELTQSQCGFIAEINSEGFLVDIATSGPKSMSLWEGISQRKFPKDFMIKGIFDRIIRDGIALFTNEPASHRNSIGVPEGHPPVNSFLGVPLMQRGRAIGIVGLGNREGGYTGQEVETLEVLTQAMVQVLMRKRTEIKSRERKYNLAVNLLGITRLQELSTRLVQADHLNSLLGEILTTAAEITGTDRGSIHFLDSATGQFKIIAHRGLEDPFIKHFSGQGWVPTCVSAQHLMRRVIIEDLTQENGLLETPDLEVFRESDICSIQSTPLISRDGHLVGMLSNFFSTKYCPAEHESHFLDLLARMAADFIESKRAQEVLQRDQQQLEELVWQRNIELNDSNRRLVEIADSITDVLYTLDREWHVTFWNSAAEKMFNINREEILGRVFWEVFPKIAESDLFDQYHYALTENKPVSFVTHGVYFPVTLEIHAYPFQDGLTVFVTDITEKKRAEDQLQESRAEMEAQARFFDALLANTTDTIAAWNREKQFVYANHPLEKLWGLKQEDFIGKTHAEVGYPLWVSELFSKQIHQVFETKQSVEGEISYPAPDGTYGCWDYIFNPLLGVDGSTELVVGVSREISERRRSEHEMARLDRLNLIGEMAASIGHEIRNPMTTIRGFLQMVNEREDNDKFKNYYKLMIEELDRANSIITEYLSMAKDKSVNIQPRYLNSIIRTLYPMIRADASYTDKQVNLELGLPPKLLFDEKEIRQLIMNLVRNGLEAMDRGGVLTIRTKVDGSEAVLEVEDQGTGIPPEVIEKIGTPFTTTKENGTGLGLAVCYSIAHRHNARIDVATGPEGTTFFVRFPIIEGLK